MDKKYFFKNIIVFLKNYFCKFSNFGQFVEKAVIILICTLSFPFAALGQNIVLQGKILDSKSKTPISSVNIYIPDLEIGAASDSAGFFILRDNRITPENEVRISCIGYRMTNLNVRAVRENPEIYLEQLILDFGGGIEITTERDNKIRNDIPVSVSYFDEQEIDDRGFHDITDVLRKDVSVSIDEDLSGPKFISIRGSNSDEVLVYYDGIKLNNAADNTVNLSFINLNDVERVEIIKGSNSSLYGSEAFGGVLNIISKQHSENTVKLQGKYGVRNTYELSGRIYKSYNNLSLNGSVLRNTSLNEFDITNPLLNNRTKTAGIDNRINSYSINAHYDMNQDNISLKLLRLDYDNTLSLSQTLNTNDFVAFSFEGGQSFWNNLNGMILYKKFNEENEYDDEISHIESNSDDTYQGISLEKNYSIKSTSLFLGYEYGYSSFRGYYQNYYKDIQVTNRNTSDLTRTRQGVVGLIKFEPSLENRVFQKMSWDGSLRIDKVTDYPGNVTFKTGIQMEGQHRKTAYRWYFTNGTNIKFPTLNQIFIAKTTRLIIGERNLEPEKNISTEVGFSVTREGLNIRKLNTIGFDIVYFRNSYLHKIFGETHTNATAMFNSKEGSSNGLEIGFKASLYDGVFGAYLGALLIDTSDRRVYAFKPDKKFIADIYSDYYGFNINLHAYYAGEETAFLFDGKDGYKEYIISPHHDYNIHVRREFSLSGNKFFVDLSMYNLRNKNQSLSVTNVIVHDRRWYLTSGLYLW